MLLCFCLWEVFNKQLAPSLLKPVNMIFCRSRVDWMMPYQGMVVLAGNQIWWTWEVEDVFEKVNMRLLLFPSKFIVIIAFCYFSVCSDFGFARLNDLTVFKFILVKLPTIGYFIQCPTLCRIILLSCSDSTFLAGSQRRQAGNEELCQSNAQANWRFGYKNPNSFV